MTDTFIQPEYDPIADFFSQEEQGDPVTIQDPTDGGVALNTPVLWPVSPPTNWNLEPMENTQAPTTNMPEHSIDKFIDSLLKYNDGQGMTDSDKVSTDVHDDFDLERMKSLLAELRTVVKDSQRAMELVEEMGSELTRIENRLPSVYSAIGKLHSPHQKTTNVGTQASDNCNQFGNSSLNSGSVTNDFGISSPVVLQEGSSSKRKRNKSGKQESSTGSKKPKNPRSSKLSNQSVSDSQTTTALDMAAIESPSAGLDPSDNVHMIRIPLTKHLENSNTRKTQRWTPMIFDDPKHKEIILSSQMPSNGHCLVLLGCDHKYRLLCSLHELSRQKKNQEMIHSVKYSKPQINLEEYHTCKRRNTHYYPVPEIHKGKETEPWITVPTGQVLNLKDSYDKYESSIKPLGLNKPSLFVCFPGSAGCPLNNPNEKPIFGGTYSQVHDSNGIQTSTLKFNLNVNIANNRFLSTFQGTKLLEVSLISGDIVNNDMVMSSLDGRQANPMEFKIDPQQQHLEFFVNTKPVEYIRQEVPQIEPNQSVNQWLQENQLDSFRLKCRFITIADASDAPVFFQSIKARYSAPISFRPCPIDILANISQEHNSEFAIFDADDTDDFTQSLSPELQALLNFDFNTN